MNISRWVILGIVASVFFGLVFLCVYTFFKDPLNIIIFLVSFTLIKGFVKIFKILSEL